MTTTQTWQQPKLQMTITRETKPQMEFVASKSPTVEEIKSSPGFLTVTPTPSWQEQWKVYRDTSGSAIVGTLEFAGVKLRSQFEKSEFKKMKTQPGYQPTHLELSGTLLQSTVKYGPYFTPAGPYLLTGTGIEHIATPYGREFIKTTGEGWEEQYTIPFTKTPVPKETAWIIPAAEIGLGTAKWWYPKVKGEISTWGRQEVKFESSSYKKVISGEKRFPELGEKLSWGERSKLHYQELMKPGDLQIKYGYKAGGIHMYSETPSFELGLTRPLHIAPQTGPSIHFMGVSSGKVSGVATKGGWFDKLVESMYGDIFQAGGKPGGAFIEPTKFEIRYGMEVSRGKYFWPYGKPAPGTAAVVGTKAETQAVFESTTKLLPTGGKFYFKLDGVKYPIDTWKALGSSDITKISTAGSDLGMADYGKVVESYIPPSSYKYPSSSGLGAVGYSIYKPSSTPSSKISYAPSSSSIFKSSSSPITSSSSKSISSVLRSSAPSYKSPSISTPSYFKPSIPYKPSTPPYRPPYSPPKYRPKKPPVSPPPAIVLPRLGLPKSKSRRTKSRLFPIIRKPSLVSLGEGITASRAAAGEFSGLVVRPFIIPSGKKKKKVRSIFSPSIKIPGGLL